MRLKLAFLLAGLALAALVALPAAVAQTSGPTGTYIVQMLDFPAVSYAGGIQGLQATKPARGQKIDPASNRVTRYAEYLVGTHDDALRRVGGGSKLYDYVYTFNGFTARLSEAQAERLGTLKNVVAVTEDELQTVDTSSTPTFLGLNAPGGLWEQLGGTGGSPNAGPNTTGAGEGIVIGIVDSGIWPESRSFSDRNASGTRIYRQIPRWHGRCAPGEDFNASMCNQKLIAAQWFNAAWGGDAALEAQRPWEFMSPRDYNGHGTHTASTSGGNANVPTTGPATALGNANGMAPRARISSYKVLWSTQDASTASGFSSDIVAAIDRAVADGVDVINYSITGSRTNFLDAVQVAFLFAADAGVFVSASAGNNGPATSTVAHPGPWVTTVAAGTHNRGGQGSVTLGNGETYTGASLATAVGPAPLIDSVDAGKAGADATQVALCYSSADTGTETVLDPAKVAGKIVVCDRGVTARVNKSLAVQEAGGVGMILLNPPPTDGSLNADFHFVPTVHLQQNHYAAVHAYAATANPTATINEATITDDEPAPFTAAFSSRGPLIAGNGDLLKPDVIAPGVDILAAVAPPGNNGLDFNLYSGTSMSAPHVAGLAALLKHKYPSWSPMAIKSALMTTGYDVVDGGTPAPNTNPVLIFRQGAGHVQPNSAANPGLVLESGFPDWISFICGTGQLSGAICTTFGTIDPSDLNVPSIAIGDLPGTQTVTRTVRNVGGAPATYNAAVSAQAGLTVGVSPSSLTLNPGQTASFEVTITRTTAALNAYAGAQLTWSDGTHNVRIPIVARPVALGAPTEVSGTGGPISYPVTFGYTGAFAASARGLVAADITEGTVEDDPTDGSCATLATGPDKIAVPVTIPANTTYARFSLFDADVAPGSDIDLCVIRLSPSGPALVGSSTTATSQEEVNLLNPMAGEYRVVVHGWGVPAGGSPFKLHTWLLGTADEGNMSVDAPASATLGQTGTIELTFSGLDPGTKYLGSVAYSGIAGLPNPTIVRVDTP